MREEEAISLAGHRDAEEMMKIAKILRGEFTLERHDCPKEEVKRRDNDHNVVDIEIKVNKTCATLGYEQGGVGLGANKAKR